MRLFAAFETYLIAILTTLLHAFIFRPFTVWKANLSSLKECWVLLRMFVNIISFLLKL